MYKNEHLIINVDLDGVLCGFEQKVCEINNIQSINEISKGKLWRSIKEYNDNVEPFFENLPLMPDAMDLWNFATGNFINVRIITATGSTPPDGGEQKRRWVAKTFGKDVIVKTVRAGEEKATYANPRSIMVDDKEKVIVPWKAAGGIGVLHTSAANSIRQLKEIIEKFSS